MTTLEAGITLAAFLREMSTKTVKSIPWEPDALARLERIPAFVRSMAKSKIEKAAQAAGETRVTVAFMDANKKQLMG